MAMPDSRASIAEVDLVSDFPNQHHLAHFSAYCQVEAKQLPPITVGFRNRLTQLREAKES